jgi:hypothetical protein
MQPYCWQNCFYINLSTYPRFTKFLFLKIKQSTRKFSVKELFSLSSIFQKLKELFLILDPRPD